MELKNQFNIEKNKKNELEKEQHDIKEELDGMEERYPYE